ncbi:MAG: hypothetical protein HY746_07020 [Elusimicrobia bacterium]|nr:hypothetical protein [Elusimicrobiota bacterium]
MPTLLIFIYLLFETTKISREKIRHQFAIDSAAFIQMTDYSNFFNRTAYVNGTFPYRIFKQEFECPPEGMLQRADSTGEECIYDIFYKAGAFPKYVGDVARHAETPLDEEKQWQIEFCGSSESCWQDADRAYMNQNLSENPGLIKGPSVKPNSSICYDSSHYAEDMSAGLTLVTCDEAAKVMLFREQAFGYAQFYVQVYKLLGSVEQSQMTVFERLIENFNFFRKSYYLNTGECKESPSTCGDEGVREFKNNRPKRDVDMHFHTIDKVTIRYKKWKPGLPPTYTLPVAVYNESLMGGPLFQLATVKNSVLKQAGKGYNVYQGWTVPSNYFSVDFHQQGVNCQQTSNKPCVHVLVAAQCPRLGIDNNCVWPYPTPKYQTRIYP